MRLLLVPFLALALAEGAPSSDCDLVIHNGRVMDPATGEILELRCTYDPETAGGKTPDGRKIKGTIHWVSATTCVDAEVRLYDCSRPDPAAGARDSGRHHPRPDGGPGQKYFSENLRRLCKNEAAEAVIR